MFVVLGASGNTGKVVAETLLRQKKKVRIVLHDAAKATASSKAGALRLLIEAIARSDGFQVLWAQVPLAVRRRAIRTI